MKNRIVHFCIPLALALAGGCATQSPNETAASTPGSDTASRPSSPASSTARSDSRVGGRSTGSSSASAPRPGQPSERSVFFEFDKSNLSAEDRKLIEAHAQYLREHPELKVRVEGNTDERGSKEYNLALGQRRAETVTKVMQLLGVSEQRVEALSYGEEKPHAQGHDENAWKQNRRSDIQY